MQFDYQKVMLHWMTSSLKQDQTERAPRQADSLRSYHIFYIKQSEQTMKQQKWEQPMMLTQVQKVILLSNDCHYRGPILLLGLAGKHSPNTSVCTWRNHKSPKAGRNRTAAFLRKKKVIAKIWRTTAQYTYYSIYTSYSRKLSAIASPSNSVNSSHENRLDLKADIARRTTYLS